MKWYIEYFVVSAILCLLFSLQRFYITNDIVYSFAVGIPQGLFLAIIATLGYEEGRKWVDRRKNKEEN